MTRRRDIRRARILIASTAITALAAFPVTASAATGPTVISGDSLFTAGCSGHSEPGTNALNTEVEPHLSVNPASAGNMVAAWQQDRWSNGGSHGNVTAFTKDGGTTWTKSVPLFTRCALVQQGLGADSPTQPGHLWDRGTDPWVSFGPSGNVVHQVSDSFNVTGAGFGNGSSILYARSADGGQTWQKPIVLQQDLNNTVLNDKESVTADPDGTHVYAVWDRLESPPSNDHANPIATEHAIGYHGPTLFASSSDGGTTWAPSKVILDPGTVNQTIANQIVVGRDGTLYNGFDLIQNVSNQNKIRGDNVAIQTSINKGLTWSGATVVSKLVPTNIVTPGDNQPIRTGDIIPDFATDTSMTSGPGAIYAVWQDARFSGTTSGIAFTKSVDGGHTWTTPTRVDDAGAAQAFNASVDVDSTGRIAVTWYDFRNDTTDTATALADIWTRFSTDGGVTWSASRRLTPSPFDIKKAPQAHGFFLGDYTGLAHAGSTFWLDAGITSNDPAPNSDIVVASTP
ncbi:MAG TPA: sialidase family protein [Kineosporiaceae bacterium]